ncbi:putative arabinose efflux permease, MFS family [Streptoalloteichus tenebrarius]|uniref:Arabinose efflux permease, MFS family n=1 Tax=Streptoalloteichus tenebrarius (strain ATCC 17920 / DSM 40477 / JCM 4838 / CBS 697.72 / NBRC 16177 / NCIMB 11028 / NRRL B-12390 / A12253. 1 / ISP 5477) TaxID=1933 RepID=A0ABT1HUM2_STRSD|nr:MFS transporter [Streptoalloteichus tenebrarius]MCP2259191.1 putative arabinose efflux permease, MFS family [Streptoalloteichus tenebrarius]BFF04328.1 MFS transporter [Streptoalloteichus tenebrarius]
MRAYRSLVGQRGVPRLVVAATVTRLATPVLNLSLLLAVVAATGSYATAGLVLTGFSVALAVCTPVIGRLLDRLHPRPVLLALLAVHLPAYALIVGAMLRHAPPAVLVGGAVVLGASAPPAAPLVRSTWSAIVPGEHLGTAFALDAVLTEVTVVAAMPVVAGLVALASPLSAVLAAGACTLVGALMLLTIPDLGSHGRDGDQRHDGGGRGGGGVLGPLAHGQVRVLLGIAACDMTAFGCMFVGISAVAAHAGESGMSGVLLGVYSLGALVSALAYGSRRRDARPRRQLAVLHAVSVAFLLTTSLTSALLVAGALLLAVGLVSGPRDTLHQLVLGDAAPIRQRTEAFAWMSTFMWIGNGAGTALAGHLVTWADGRHHTSFLAAAVASGLATLLSLLLRRATERGEPAQDAPPREDPVAPGARPGQRSTVDG